MAASANSALGAALSKDADARRAVQNLSAEQQRLKDAIAAQNALKNNASLDVFKAFQNLDLANKNGDSSQDRPSASAQLTEAKEAAFSVNASADATIAALTQALNGVNEKLNAAKSYLDQQASRSAYAWAEAPAAQ